MEVYKQEVVKRVQKKKKKKRGRRQEVTDMVLKDRTTVKISQSGFCFSVTRLYRVVTSL